MDAGTLQKLFELLFESVCLSLSLFVLLESSNEIHVKLSFSRGERETERKWKEREREIHLVPREFLSRLLMRRNDESRLPSAVS